MRHSVDAVLKAACFHFMCTTVLQQGKIEVDQSVFALLCYMFLLLVVFKSRGATS